jgi:hypothetical protein
VVLRFARFGVALMAVLLAAVAGPSAAVLAAEPPPGVVFDGSVTVTVSGATFNRANPIGPLVGATVRLKVLRAGDEPEADRLIQTLTATTDTAGIAAFGGVGRQAGDGPAILLVADAHLDGPDEGGIMPSCFTQYSWDAAPVVAEAGLQVSIELADAAPSSSFWCVQVTPPPDGAVLAATGRPQVTPPATDVGSSEPASGAAGPAIAGLLVVAALALIPLRPRRRATVRARISRSR